MHGLILDAKLKIVNASLYKVTFRFFNKKFNLHQLNYLPYMYIVAFCIHLVHFESL